MDFDFDLVPHNIPSHIPKMQDLYDDLFSGGKGFRAALVWSVAKECGLSTQDQELLARCIEFVHNSSLLHDDFIDQAPLRRGKPASWTKYGGGYSILAGDYLLARVMRDLSARGSLKLIAFTSEMILDLVEGEWLQDATLKRVDVTAAEIARIHSKKTSSLFTWCFQAPRFLKEELSVQDELFKLIGENFGALLQRSDDLLDFNIRNYESKSFFTDIKAGYFNSFAVELLSSVDSDRRAKAFDCQSLEEFVASYEIDIESSLAAFDEESQRLLKELENALRSCKEFSSEFIEELIDGAHKIYFRK